MPYTLFFPLSIALFCPGSCGGCRCSTEAQAALQQLQCTLEDLKHIGRATASTAVSGMLSGSSLSEVTAYTFTAQVTVLLFILCACRSAETYPILCGATPVRLEKQVNTALGII